MERREANIPDAKERIRLLTNYGSSIEVDYHVPAVRYFRSGQEMTRMANLYLDDGNLEHAYVLYIKFMTLFLEKVRKHPGYRTVPSHLKETIMRKLRDVMPIAETLKQQLLDQYTLEYKRYLDEIRKEERKRELQAAAAAASAAAAAAAASDRSISLASRPEGPIATVPPIVLDTITYPDCVANGNKQKPENNILPSSSKPAVHRDTKPKFSGKASVKESLFPHYTGLRLILVPSNIVSAFLRIANKNTMENRETCGILAGVPKGNEFEISHLIIPKQTGTSDTCSATNEEEISEYINDKNLFSLGWIHTHPTQTAFLSAVDLHTQYSYQRLFDESIAIVCAPRYNENEIYSLTQDYGLPLIGQCTKTGFHTHPTDKPIYKRAEHIQMCDDLQVEVVDLQ